MQNNEIKTYSNGIKHIAKDAVGAKNLDGDLRRNELTVLRLYIQKYPEKAREFIKTIDKRLKIT